MSDSKKKFASHREFPKVVSVDATLSQAKPTQITLWIIYKKKN